ncbi:hypothetical protein VSS86_19035, partial [Bacillus safensis]|nr:hypothetical protein [Bacillus safensis]
MTNLKKVLSGVTAAACAFSVVSFFPSTSQASEIEKNVKETINVEVTNFSTPLYENALTKGN